MLYSTLSPVPFFLLLAVVMLPVGGLAGPNLLPRSFFPDVLQVAEVGADAGATKDPSCKTPSIISAHKVPFELSQYFATGQSSDSAGVASQRKIFSPRI